ncbi:hypothetical protein RJ55_08240 [Drechmeria coniospora]|nr:hypothetical protein RJ55_08240 [Drechmeria coniospora]
MQRPSSTDACSSLPPVHFHGDAMARVLWTADDEARATIVHDKFASTKYRLGSFLGKGGWSVVYKALRVSDGRVFAAKSTKAIQQTRREARILGDLKHENILKLVEWYEEPGNVGCALLVTELCAYGNLQGRIDEASPRSLAVEEILQMVRQMGRALHYLHGQALFHTDLKASNMVLRSLEPFDVVLADCADVKRFDGRQRHQLRGTPEYYSPEIGQHGTHQGPGDDVWALGITMLATMAQRPPCRCRKDEVEAYAATCSGHVRELLALNPQHDMVRLLAGLLAWELNDRVTAKTAAESATALLLRERAGQGEDGGTLGIEAPHNFRPVTFW